MPKNLFRRNRNPLLALLQQQQEGPPAAKSGSDVLDEVIDLDRQNPLPAPTHQLDPSAMTMPSRSHLLKTLAAGKPEPEIGKAMLPGASTLTTSSYKPPPMVGPQQMTPQDTSTWTGEDFLLDTAEKAGQMNQEARLAKTSPSKQTTQKFEDIPIPGIGPTEAKSWSSPDEAQSALFQKAAAIGMPMGHVANVASGVEAMAKKYGEKLQTEDQAREALRREFQDTPEIDEAIRNAEAALAQAKSERKTPGALEYIAMALMNLSGINPRMSADLVLGLGNQEEREQTLEEQLFGLQQQQIGAKMGGRRDFRRQELAQEQLAQQLAQQEAKETEGGRRWEREMGLKEGKAGLDAIQRELGQLRTQVGSTMDEKVRADLLRQISVTRKDPRLEKLFTPGGGSP